MSGSDVIIWPRDAENAKTCFRSSGDTTAKTHGDNETKSGDTKSHLILESFIFEIGLPSYPTTWAPATVM